MIFLIVASAACLYYIVRQLRRTYIVKTFVIAKSRIFGWALPSVVSAAIALVLFLTLGYMNAVICILSLTVFVALFRLVFFLLKKAFKLEFKFDLALILAVVLSIVYFGVGWYLAHDVKMTVYNIDAASYNGEKFRVVQFADSHIGGVFDANKFEEYVAEMNACSPDAVLITGDFVDDDTSREDMLGSCSALKGFTDVTYGVYFSYGNHDEGYYSEEARGWTNAEFVAALESAGVVILEDETVKLGNGITIVGRRDKSDKNRKDIGELLETVSDGEYTIILDHQPVDYAAEASAKAGLVLSGHTHGGQMFPINIAVAIANDRVYGHEKRGDTDFIVTSGIADWAIKFKTGCVSEYVVIDIT